MVSAARPAGSAEAGSCAAAAVPLARPLAAASHMAIWVNADIATLGKGGGGGRVVPCVGEGDCERRVAWFLK